MKLLNTRTYISLGLVSLVSTALLAASSLAFFCTGNVTKGKISWCAALV